MLPRNVYVNNILLSQELVDPNISQRYLLVNQLFAVHSTQDLEKYYIVKKRKN